MALVCAIIASGCSKLSGQGKPKKIPRANLSALVGQPAPDFTINDLDGKPFKLSDQRGKVVFLDFWATWCPPCQMSVPELIKLHEQYSGKNVEIASISVDDNTAKVKKFVELKGIKHRQLFAGDSQVDRVYGVTGIPTFVVIDTSGTISNLWTGFSPSMADDWREELDRLLK